MFFGTQCTCVLNRDAAIMESKVSVVDELSCSAIDISASASSCRLSSVIGVSRLAAISRDSPHYDNQHSHPTSN